MDCQGVRHTCMYCTERFLTCMWQYSCCALAEAGYFYHSQHHQTDCSRHTKQLACKGCDSCCVHLLTHSIAVCGYAQSGFKTSAWSTLTCMRVIFVILACMAIHHVSACNAGLSVAHEQQHHSCGHSRVRETARKFSNKYDESVAAAKAIGLSLPLGSLPQRQLSAISHASDSAAESAASAASVASVAVAADVDSSSSRSRSRRLAQDGAGGNIPIRIWAEYQGSSGLDADLQKKLRDTVNVAMGVLQKYLKVSLHVEHNTWLLIDLYKVILLTTVLHFSSPCASAVFCSNSMSAALPDDAFVRNGCFGYVEFMCYVKYDGALLYPFLLCRFAVLHQAVCLCLLCVCCGIQPATAISFSRTLSARSPPPQMLTPVVWLM